MEIHEEEEEPKSVQYPLDLHSYKILNELGVSFNAVVYKALCLPMNSAPVAIKSIDLCDSRLDFDDVVREAKTLSVISHPNILNRHCSFAFDDRLWVVMPFMAGGSLQSIISHSFPDGLGEPCIDVVVKEILKALSYLHGQGRLHRDIKASNILIDSNGLVKLADFGVSASIYESYSSEVAGKPYWMAPEVIHSHEGYSFMADIWSLGITALELAHGRPPLSQLPPSLSMILEIKKRFHFSDFKKDRKGNNKKFPRTFKDMVASCLDQDPLKRPTAEKLLKHPFFQNCKGSEILVKNLLQGLPSVEIRYRESRTKNDSNMDNDDGERDPSKQNVEERRICGWKFNEGGLKLDLVFPTEPKNDTVAKQVRVEGETIIQDMGGELDDQEELFFAESGTDLPYPKAAEAESLMGTLGRDRIGEVQIGGEDINKEAILDTVMELLGRFEEQLRQVKTLINEVLGDEVKEKDWEHMQQLQHSSCDSNSD